MREFQNQKEPNQPKQNPKQTKTPKLKTKQQNPNPNPKTTNTLKPQTKTQATMHGYFHPAANASPRTSLTEIAVLLYT